MYDSIVAAALSPRAMFVHSAVLTSVIGNLNANRARLALGYVSERTNGSYFWNNKS